jgi:Zn-dependent peptidase ImmA (M78 family)
MAKFQLKMATQLGEKIAADFGFTEFPIKPLEIAQKRGIRVEAKPSDVKGVSGAMIFANGNATIIYSRDLSNKGFENFSICHELGHYFLPGHPEEITKQGGTHFSRANFTESSSIELEADHFASGLLLPSGLTRKFLDSQQVGLEGILALADAAESSRTAAAIRAAECSNYPVAVIVSRDEQVAYAFLSEGFKQLGELAWLKKGTPLPSSLTRRFNANPANISQASKTCGETWLGDWFGGPKGIALDEEVLGLGSYGFTLTTLSSESRLSAPDEEEDEDAELEKSWTPKFAYGR